MIWIVGSFVGAITAAFAFLLWAVFRHEPEPLDDWERHLRGDA